MNKLYSVVAVCMCSFQLAVAQTCPSFTTTNLGSNPNTYYPANQATVTAGASSIALGAATSGSSAIAPGDMLLIIQMQGAQINSSNTSSYGSNGAGGTGYLNNGAMLAGNMEYVVANNSVTLAGGTLNLRTPLVNSYQKSAYTGPNGQYTYQIVRVPVYYDLKLGGTITAPAWDGSTGGVVVLFATDNINMNSQQVIASGKGFRGGGGRKLSGDPSGSNTDYVSLSPIDAGASKGEGIAGTPNFMYNNGSLLTNGSEGYPSGSYDRGAPGNAGGGGTDGNPTANDQNTGGGGGGNGGAGGGGGNSWSTAITCGGKGGSAFAQVSGSRLVMGGGGGAGTTNDGTGNLANGLSSSGAPGGGIIIMISQGTITGAGFLLANGSSANSTVQNDGAGGGGAGGSILLQANAGGTSGVVASAAGGNGGSNQTGGGAKHGPGGGGGGGVIYSSGTLGAGSTSGSGTAGLTAGNTTAYGASSGSAGKTVTNMAAGSYASPNLACAVLATSYIDLSAKLNNGAVHLTWDATGETTTENYIVEKSGDGTHFSAIATVNPKFPATAVDSYQYDDDGNFTDLGTIYYRIVEARTTGDSSYSKIVPVQTSSTQEVFIAYPNPTAGPVTVRFNSAAPRTMNLQLFNLQGAMVWQQVYSANAGMNTLSVGKFSSLPEGLYILGWKDGQAGGQVKVMVRH